jgi:hypothetical protein
MAKKYVKNYECTPPIYKDRHDHAAGRIRVRLPCFCRNEYQYGLFHGRRQTRRPHCFVHRSVGRHSSDHAGGASHTRHCPTEPVYKSRTRIVLLSFTNDETMWYNMTQQAQLQVDGGDNSSSTSNVGAQVVAGGKALQLMDQIVTVTLCLPWRSIRLWSCSPCAIWSPL